MSESGGQEPAPVGEGDEEVDYGVTQQLLPQQLPQGTLPPAPGDSGVI